MKFHRGVIRVLAAALFLFCSQSYAQTCTSFPYPLTAGTTASGSQVIADLTYVANCKSQVPSFSVYLSSNQSFSSGALTKVALNTKTYDVGSYFDASANRYIPQLAGKYLIVGQIYVMGIAGNFTVAISKSGSYVAQSYLPMNGAISQVSSIVSLNGTSDFVELWGEASGTSLQFTGGPTWTFLQGYWLGP
jgi:hypothetical protein